MAAVVGAFAAGGAQAATFNVTTSSTTAGFWRVDCAHTNSTGLTQCAGQGGATIEIPFLSVDPSPTESTGTIEIDLATGAITGGGYAVNGTGDIVATIDISVLFGLPNGTASATLSINDSMQTWLATPAASVVGEDFLYNPGVFTDPASPSVTCAPAASAVCNTPTVLAIIADGGLPLSHAPNPTAQLLLDFNAAQTAGTMQFASDTFTPNDGTNPAIGPNILGTRTIGSTTVTLAATVPEPGVLMLLGAGLAALALLGRRP